MSGKKKGGRTASLVWKLAAPFAAELGLSIWDVRFLREGGSWVLRIIIDKDDGVGIEDCEKMSRAMDAPLDELDPIREPYSLEVSSPGVNRELTREEHFRACMGKPVRARLIRPAEDGSRRISGRLSDYDGGSVTLETGDAGKVSVVLKDTSSVRLVEDDDLEEMEES